PPHRPEVELPNAFRIIGTQVIPQEFRKEMMVPEPSSLIFQCHDEEIRPLELLEGFLPAGAAGDRVAQRATERAEDRGLEQELPDVVRLARQNLLSQKVEDISMLARERRDEPGGIAAAPHGEGSELETGNPPLRHRRDR